MGKINTLLLFWGKKGGGAKYSLELAKELSNRNDVNLHLSISHQCEIYDQFDQLSLPCFNITTYTSTPGFLYKWCFGRQHLAGRLAAYLSKHQIQTLIIGMDFFWGPVIYKAAETAKTQTIHVVHEPKPHPRESMFIYLYKRLTIGKTIAKADRLVTLTANVKKFITDKFGVDRDKISVIPHGIFSYYKAEEPRQITEDSEVKLLFFGRIEYYKGLDILLKAFILLERQREHVRLEVWGDGDLSEYRPLIGRIQRIHIENRWLSEGEISAIFQQCHICILPYREASQSGIAGIASRAALPIVACPNPGLEEQLSDTGAVIAASFTPESLQKAILKVVDDPGFYEDLSRKSLEYSKNLSWQKIASEFNQLSKELKDAIR